MRVTCAACKNELENDARVCPGCGTPVERKVGAAAPSHPDNPSPVQSTSMSQRNLPRITDREEQTVLPVRVNDLLSNRYRLEGKIGEGGMGTVYAGHDSELDRKVAVKLLASNLVNDPEVVERFEREAKLTAKLDHPNIVPIYDVGRHEGRPFIVMKLLQGDTLAGVLRHKGGLTSDETLRLMKQIGAGLDYIHEKGFIHRDIKAGNLHLAADGVATILDFGILRSRDGSKGLTRTGMVMGTPHYMAPEQALGLKDVDHRVDLYALAVVLFECLTGTLPFEADSELRLIQMQAHAPPPEILDRAPWVSKPVADVVRRALAKRPEERFSSAAQLIGALEAAYGESKGQPATMGSAAPTAVPANTLPSLRAKQVDVGGAPAAALPKLPRWGGVGAMVLVAVGLLFWQRWSAAGAQVVADAGVPVVVTSLVEAGAVAGGPDEADAGAELLVTNAAADGGQPPKRKGHVSVMSSHQGEPYWATVFIDGIAKGRTPLGLDLTAGRYTIRIERAGFRTQEREVRIAPGKSTTLRVDLVP